MYKQKYLKYKLKYINLKIQMGGASAPPPPPPPVPHSNITLLDILNKQLTKYDINIINENYKIVHYGKR